MKLCPTAPAGHAALVFTRDLDPLSYARLVHPLGEAGAVSFCGPAPSRTGRVVWQDSRWSSHALAHRQCDVGRHKFMSFGTWPRQRHGEPKSKRVTANAVSVCANWVDLDFYKLPAWAAVPSPVVLEALLNLCGERGWPVPSYAMNSGRGLLVVWLYDAIPAQAGLARHRAVQETLHQAFQPLGSDASAKTITKVFRMPKTFNERARLHVGMLWPVHVRDVTRGSFDALADVVLPYRRKSKKERDAEAIAAKVERVAARLANRKPREGHAGARLGGRSYWRTFREDLERLFDLRHGNGSVPDGEGRNAWLLALTYAACWDMPASEVEGYVRAQAARCGLTVAEAMDKTTSIRSKALEAARGVKVVWKIRKVDPRYRPSPGHVIDLLTVTSGEMKRADLRMLIDAARRAENAAGRVEKARRAAGVKARNGQQTFRLEIGLLALDMLGPDMGLTVAGVAEFFSLSPRYVTTAIRDARAIEAIGKVTPAKAKRTNKVVPAPQPPEPVAQSVSRSRTSPAPLGSMTRLRTKCYGVLERPSPCLL